MPKADVMVTVEGGVAQVNVFKPGILVELRDYDVEGMSPDEEFIWTDENGDRCWRYFVNNQEVSDECR